jgi:hypothetical protein
VQALALVLVRQQLHVQEAQLVLLVLGHPEVGLLLLELQALVLSTNWAQQQVL